MMKLPKIIRDYIDATRLQKEHYCYSKVLRENPFFKRLNQGFCDIEKANSAAKEVRMSRETFQTLRLIDYKGFSICTEEKDLQLGHIWYSVIIVDTLIPFGEFELI